MNAAAVIKLERCMRVCKLKMTKITDPSIKTSLPPNGRFRADMLDMLSTYGDMQVFALPCQ